MKNDELFITTDFEHAIAVRSQKIKVKARNTNSNRKEFVFDISPIEAGQIIDQYYNHDLFVDAYDFYLASKELKSRIRDMED